MEYVRKSIRFNIVNSKILSKFVFNVIFINVMRCAIWYHLYNIKIVKNTHGGVILLVK